MEPILVYGHPLGSSMGLIAAFEWLGEPYRLSRVKMVDDMLTEEFRRLNGRQETPVLITEDRRVITETSALATWLEARDTKRRISFPQGTAEADRMHQLVGFLNTGFTGAFTPLWVALEMSEANPDYQAALRRFGREQVEDRHRRLEEMVGDDRYLVGDHPTLADAVFIGVARWAEFFEVVSPERFPCITALRARLESDPAVKFATAIEEGKAAAGSGAMRGEVPLPELWKLLWG